MQIVGTDFPQQEEVHLEALSMILNSQTAPLIPSCNYLFPVSSSGEFEEFADIVSSVGISSTVGPSQRLAITDPSFVRMITSMLAAKSRQTGFFRDIQNKAPITAPFDTGIGELWAYNMADPKWSKKVTQNVARERNLDLRDEYVHEISSLRSDQLMFIDETGLDKSIGTRRKGWAPRGQRPRQIKRFHRGARFQILPAYTQDGVIHFRVYEGSTDTKVFENFIEELLPYCGKWPNPRSVLIMDNASFHHSKKIQRLCDDAGVILRYLPPYSPDLNPIEEFFGELKTYIRQVWHEHEGFIKADFLSFLEECVTVVGGREASAKGHFRRAGISIDELSE
jgi:transposase